MSFYPNYLHYDITLSPHQQGKWCLILLKGIPQQAQSLPFCLSIHHQDNEEFEETHYLKSYAYLGSSWRIGLIFIPLQTDYVRIYPIADLIKPTSFSSLYGTIYSLRRFQAALFLIAHSPKIFLKTLFCKPLHLKKRFRLALLKSQQNFIPNLSYKKWCFFYDQWQKKEKEILLNSPYRKIWPFFIVNHKNFSIQSKDKSLQTQWINSLTSPLSSALPTYILLKHDKELLRPHTLCVYIDQAARHHYPPALYADSDYLDSNKQRHTPFFKPGFNLPTLLTGLLTEDPWFIRQDIFKAFQKQSSQIFTSIYAKRLAIGLYLWQNNLTCHHVPFILSHKTTHPTKTDKIAMSKVIENFKNQHHFNFYSQFEKLPFSISFKDEKHPVSIVIPTTISSKTIQNCLWKILTKTHYPNFEVLLIISQKTDLTPQQKYYLAPLEKYKNVRVLLFKTPTFNFSQSCNYGIAHTTHPFIALVNDDIEPITPTWLGSMMGYMQLKTVGAVGAKLYYPNGEIQHAGIIMGAANLCEHAGRFQTDNHFFLDYDHEVSAVTGACMVIRKEAYYDINGFNEAYEIAYNDVDFCLRLVEADYHIIQCQTAKLIHHESLSLNHHYTGKRVGKEREEILSLREANQYICDNDVFYNPNLSLQRGMDYSLAFPPRISIPFGIDP